MTVVIPLQGRWLMTDFYWLIPNRYRYRYRVSYRAEGDIIQSIYSEILYCHFRIR